MADRYWHKLCQVPTLKKAWHYVRDDLRDDFIDDVVRHSDYGQFLEQNIASLAAKLKATVFYPSSLAEVDVPKSELSIRPGSAPDIEDRIVAHAIIYLIAPSLDKNLSDGVYSYRLKNDYEKSDCLFKDYDLQRYSFLRRRTIRRFKIHDEWYKQWPEYDELTRYFYEEKGYKYLALTDISAYFENVQHTLLRDLLLRYAPRESNRIVNLLMTMLRRWTLKSGDAVDVGRGIPQGTEVGSFLGNIFLIPLDKRFDSLSHKHDVRYFRYMDDIKVFTKDKYLARDMVLEVERNLRELHLNLQGAKSQILEGNDIKRRLFDPRMEELNRAYLECEKLSERERVHRRAEYEERFSRACAMRGNALSPEASSRLFRRQLTAYRLIGSSKLIKKALRTACETIEYKTLRHSLLYVTRFPQARTVPNRLCNQLVRAPERPSYWKASVISALKFCSQVPAQFMPQLWHMLRSRSSNWYIKVQVAALLAQYPQPESKLRALMTLFRSEPNVHVKRAILFILTQLRQEQREQFLRKATANSEPAVIRFANMIEAIATEEKEARYWAKRIGDLSISSDHFINNIHIIQLIGRSESFHKVYDEVVSALRKRLRVARQKALRANIKEGIRRLSYQRFS